MKQRFLLKMMLASLMLVGFSAQAMAVSDGDILTVTADGAQKGWQYQVTDAANKKVLLYTAYDAADREGVKPSGDITISDAVTIGEETYTVVAVSYPEATYETGAFSSCTDITSVTITGSNIKTIGKYAFRSCTKLETATLGSVEEIGEYSFQYTNSLSSFTANNLVTVGRYAMSRSGIQTLTLSNTVKTIEGCAFEYSELQTLTIGTGLTTIEYSGYGTFQYAQSLATITVDEGNATFSSEDGILYSKDKKTLWVYPMGKTDTEVTVKSGVTTIGDYAFNGNTTIKSLIIPEGVTAVNQQALRDMYYLERLQLPSTITAFNYTNAIGCSNLKTVVVLKMVPEKFLFDNGYGSYSFKDRIPADAKLYVPYTALKAYQEFADNTFGTEYTCPLVQPAYEYTTFACTSGVDFSGADGLTAYVASSFDGTKVTLTPKTEAPAGTGMVLKGTAGKIYLLNVKDGAAAVGDNLLKGVTTDFTISQIDGAYTNFLLGDAGFGKVSTTGTLAAGKAYLQLETSKITSGARSIDIDIDDDNVTGIKLIEQTSGQNVYYDLRGHRVLNPRKGLFILNGKKVIIK